MNLQYVYLPDDLLKALSHKTDIHFDGSHRNVKGCQEQGR